MQIGNYIRRLAEKRAIACSLRREVEAGFQRNSRETKKPLSEKMSKKQDNEEFDPGSGRTLAACLTHASQGENRSLLL